MKLFDTMKSLVKRGRQRELQQKSAPFLWPVMGHGMPMWQMGNFLSYAGEGFSLNSVIYSAIMYKTRAVTQAPARAYVQDANGPELLPPTHPLARLTLRPNVYMSWMELQGLQEVYLNLSGNAYFYIDREKSKNGVPNGIYALRPDQVYIIPSSSGLEGYLYVPQGGSLNDGLPILIEDMVHVKFPNPLDAYEGLGYGLSPLAPLAQSGDVDNSATKLIKSVFDRGAMPIGLLKYKIPLDDDQVKTIKSRWRDIYGGFQNWADIGVLDSDSAYERLSQNFNELGFDGLDQRNESRIIGPFGVPPILIGTRFGLERSTFSNYEEARRAFWEDTMQYEMRLFETELQYAVTGNDGSYLMYDFSAVPALKPNVVPLVEAATKLWSMGVPVNDALKLVGIRSNGIEGGDVSYVPTTVRDTSIPLPTQPVKLELPTESVKKKS